MIVKIAGSDIARLKNAIENTGRELRKELLIAVSKTAKKSKSIINKEIRTELVRKSRDLNWSIKVDKDPNGYDLTAEVIVKKEKRLGLRHFGARQNARGVSYRISKTRGQKFIAGAFQGPRPGVIREKWKGNVFIRTQKTRLPIVQRFGPSPWGVFVVGKKKRPSIKITQTELLKQINERIRFLGLKKSGTI